MKHSLADRGNVACGHRDCLHDQGRLVVVIHCPAGDTPRVAIDDQRDVQPAFPGRHVGDVTDEDLAWGISREVPAYQVRDRRRLLIGPGGAHPGAARLAGDQAGLAHQGPDQVRAAREPPADQDRVDPPVPVPPIVLDEHVLDHRPQLHPSSCRRRLGSGSPIVIPRPRHTQPRAHLFHQIARQPVLVHSGPLRVDELILRRHRKSFAKKAAAFPRNSRSNRNSRTSRSNSASRARSEIVNGSSTSG